MNIAVYTLTRERIEYTQHCLPLLHDKAGCSFDHYVVDNGSKDGTLEWLQHNSDLFQMLVPLPTNIGIARAANLILYHINRNSYDLVIKFDNDCEVHSDSILAQVADFYESLGERKEEYVVSPRVVGIQTIAPRSALHQIGNHIFGATKIVGGIFHVVPQSIYRQYRYNELLPKAWGNDGHFCHWLREQNIAIGYLEDLEVAHFETTAGQRLRYPAYFQRKQQEERA